MSEPPNAQTKELPPAMPAPSERVERVLLLDVLRGVALFGILMVNIQHLFYPGSAAQLSAGSSWADRAVYFLIHFLFEGKFFPVYSFLFGLGAYVLIRRVERAGGDVGAFFRRRTNVLAGLGIAHGILLWPGDILFQYALVSKPFIGIFRNKSPRSLLRWSLGLILATTALLALFALVPSEASGESAADVAEEVRAYTQPSYLAVTARRARDFGFNAVALVVMGPVLLGLFLLGLHAGLTGRLFDPAALRRDLAWTLPVGLTLSAVYAYLGGVNSAGGVRATMTAASLNIVGGIILSQAYVCLIALAWPRLTALAPAGRMALTHYLTQSLILSTLAYGYGFGYYNKIGPAALAAIAVAIYAAQLAFSHWWLARHSQGPMEKLWRNMSN